ncbi:PREDICTED: telomere repeat-binding [Prunus dulcis]|uniref:PREDICTED: telomere repeat-binding n=1 Tax=Prunus dulcis TaxID=3755 RepID=A0A5E4FSP8_PRUDU|nr:PREDICTED: telomere repeat-binding [Prunus dulcis]
MYVQNSEDCKDHRLLGSSEKLEIECSPAKSREEISEDESVSRINTRKGSKQTKLYTSWTSSQVMKFIEGVSQCGVGKWSEMRRLLFSSCLHRTAVDLISLDFQDKWLNLLKIKRDISKRASDHVPVSVLQRVMELAVIYPYPRQKKVRS